MAFTYLRVLSPSRDFSNYPPTMSSAASSSRESSPDNAPLASLKASSSKAAQKAKSKAPADKGNRNEGSDPHWTYQPPAKSVRLEKSADVGSFSWDELNGNDDLELWLVRIPDGVKPKYLVDAQLDLPPNTKHDATSSAKLGVLQRKHVAYDIWSVGDDAPEDMPIGGEEIKGISCLLPRKTGKGALYSAPHSIARTVVLSAQPVTPTLDSTIPPNTRPVFKNDPRQIHPEELLTHSFVPYGADSAMHAPLAEPRPETPPAMEVDTEVLVPATPDQPVKTKSEKKGKGKKRKGDDVVAEVPTKKSKKAKATA
ncbi:unnamed protein product [Mycena citricolor]|uniref:Uncharacterized protein n=1 Tax=Mycena citricolor TaxID=2018698 RepID=A0AAD2HVR5_9AGAR|nr:unnamed protein product [Mycena citricolor]CAK5281072.1 unnamed protein product [Mycena citricolor]